MSLVSGLGFLFRVRIIFRLWLHIFGSIFWGRLIFEIRFIKPISVFTVGSQLRASTVMLQEYVLEPMFMNNYLKMNCTSMKIGRVFVSLMMEGGSLFKLASVIHCLLFLIINNKC